MSLDPSTTSLHLDAQLCFRLYRGERSLLGTYRELLDSLGLTYPQYLVMLVLWEDDDLPVSQIGVRLSLDTGTLSPLLRRMESAGWISRTRDPSDERVVRVALTGDGAALKDRATQVPRTLAERTGLDAEESATLARLLDKLCASLAAPPPDLSTNPIGDHR